MSQTETITKWTIDPAHSEIGFKTKHLVISTVTGKFEEFDGSIEVNAEADDFEGASVYFEADISSINTGVEVRDAHLKSEDFFKADEYPKLTFESESLEKVGDGEYTMTGDLTIRGTTKTVIFDVTHGGTVEDPYGNTKAGFEVTGKIKRKEFGLKWDAVTETGNVVVGNEITLQLNVQLTKEEEEE